MTEDIKNLPRAKEPIEWSKVRTMFFWGGVAIVMFICTTLYLTEKTIEWNNKYGFQNPIIIKIRPLIYNKQTKVEQPITQIIVKPAQAIEVKKIKCYDPITCIREVGEEVGRTNAEIMRMIRIAQKEAICNTKKLDRCVPNDGVIGLGIDPKAKNPNSTAKGIFQILDGTWKLYECTGDVFNIEDNTRCANKIMFDGYKKATPQGVRAWEVCNNGSVDCSY